MRYIYYIVIISVLLIASPLRAEDIIKVLMMDSPFDPLPTEEAVTVQSINGKIFINDHVYEGSLSILKDEKGLFVVKHLPFEEYIEGVVSSEIDKDWDMEALKAQAVISRTYATYYKKLNEGKGYHLTSTVLHQLYNGENVHSLISYATQLTRGEILMYQNMPIKAFYHASCEGKTELPEEVWGEQYPYLNSVDCQDRDTPYENWQRKFTLNELAQALNMDKIDEIMVKSYTSTGRVKSLIIAAKSEDQHETSMEIDAAKLRRIIGYDELPSTNFKLIPGAGEVIFKGKGFGHGVGLSQWGALEMARQGKDYRQILTHYYPGTVIESIDPHFSVRYNTLPADN
jgi:stage II sporulation protein D